LRIIRQEIGLLREENRKQNAEIMNMKETVHSQNQTIHQHEITMKELVDKEMKKSSNCYKNNDCSSEKHKQSNKRPARLLPLQLLFDRDDDDDDHTTKKPPRKFYGPPTNCSDLARLGYTLNGYYLVQHNYANTVTKHSYNFSISLETDIVYCTFKQESTFNPSLMEHRLVLSPSLKKQVIEEQNQILAYNGHLGQFNLTSYSTERKEDESIRELSKENAELPHIFKDFRSSKFYIGNFDKRSVKIYINHLIIEAFCVTLKRNSL